MVKKFLKALYVTFLLSIVFLIVCTGGFYFLGLLYDYLTEIGLKDDKHLASFMAIVLGITSLLCSLYYAFFIKDEDDF